MSCTGFKIYFLKIADRLSVEFRTSVCAQSGIGMRRTFIARSLLAYIYRAYFGLHVVQKCGFYYRNPKNSEL